MVDRAAPGSGTERAARQARGRADWSRAGAEPSVAEVLEDPLVHLVLRRDGLTPSDLRRAMETARSGWIPADRGPLDLAGAPRNACPARATWLERRLRGEQMVDFVNRERARC
jgi:hypothetical protein